VVALPYVVAPRANTRQDATGLVSLRATLPPAAALLLALSACGSSSSGTPSTSAPTLTAPPAASGVVHVIMKNLAFTASSVTIRLGQSVKWTNKEPDVNPILHNVTSADGTTFMSSNFGPGGSYTYTPKVAGTIAYTCTIHPAMTGTLIVRQ
jgi:plastocyanin